MIKQEELAKNGNVAEEVERSKPTKVLGAMWDPSDDTLSFRYSKLLDTKIEHTKRGISKIIPAIFDVNGEIAPFILRGKMILSMTWVIRSQRKIPLSQTKPELRRRKIYIVLKIPIMRNFQPHLAQ